MGISVPSHSYSSGYACARRCKRKVIGAIFEVPDFEATPIQPLPLGFRGKSVDFTTCGTGNSGFNSPIRPPKTEPHNRSERLNGRSVDPQKAEPL